MASSVALVSERNSNQTAPSPQLHPSVSGEQDPAAALWGSHADYSQARHTVELCFSFGLVFFLLSLVNSVFIPTTINLKTKGQCVLLFLSRVNQFYTWPNIVMLLQKKTIGCW